MAYANYLLSRYEKKLKNYEQELNYLKKAINIFLIQEKKNLNLLLSIALMIFCKYQKTLMLVN